MNTPPPVTALAWKLTIAVICTLILIAGADDAGTTLMNLAASAHYRDSERAALASYILAAGSLFVAVFALAVLCVAGRSLLKDVARVPLCPDVPADHLQIPFLVLMGTYLALTNLALVITGIITAFGQEYYSVYAFLYRYSAPLLKLAIGLSLMAAPRRWSLSLEKFRHRPRSSHNESKS